MINKLLQSTILISVIVVLCCLLSPFPVRADAAPPPDPSVGSTMPYRPIKTMVQMVSETVLIDIPVPDMTHETPGFPQSSPNIFHVSTNFLMRNRGSNEEKMQVIFPLTNLHAPIWYESNYKIVGSSFHAMVNGEEHTISFISTPPELTSTDQNPYALPEGKYIQDVSWAAFEALFPVNQDILLEINYDMIGLDFKGIEYIIETGAGWYGAIQSADIRVRLPYPAVEEAIVSANPGYILSGNEIQWKLTNFEPTRKDNFYISIVNPYTWIELHDVRENAEQKPDNANDWFELGRKYARTDFPGYPPDCNSPSTYGYISRDIANLAAEAFQNAATIKPDWGEAHSELAMALWAANATSTQPPSNAIRQKIIQELDLAWKGIFNYGFYPAEDEFSIVKCLNEANPGLDLEWPAVTIATPSPSLTPSITLTRTATLTKLPTATLTALPSATLAPSLMPTVVKKTSSGAGRVGGTAAGIIILLGGVIFFYRRYRQRMK